MVTPLGPDQQLSLTQPTQELNNIVQYLAELITTIRAAGGAWVTKSIGHNAAGATGTCFTATTDQVVLFVQVSSTNGADAVTIDWVDDSEGTTHNLITNGVIGAAYPLYLPGPFALEEGDTLTYSGADADLDFVVTWQEALV